MEQGAFGDLVIFVPGILGSKLARREGKRLVTAWDFSIRHLPALLKTIVTDGLVLTGNGVEPPDDGIEAVDLFSYQLLPGFFGVDDYASIIDSLQRSVGKRQVLTFPYDWRLSNRHSAKRLEIVASDALKHWKAESGNSDARLWLVCHSMGGLVARYFCESFGGAAHTRAIVTIGTPHRGSVRALDALVNGKRFGPFNLTPMVRSLPSVYELLPLFPVLRHESDNGFERYRVAELFGLDHVTGKDIASSSAPDSTVLPPALPGLDRDMLKRSVEFHAGIRISAEARAAAGEPSPYRQEAFFNRRQSTALSAKWEGKKLRILDTYPELRSGKWVDEDARGDGTVPSFSSVPIEWKDTQWNAIPVAEKHAEMQVAVALQRMLFNWLRPLDVRGKKGGPIDDADVISLDVPSAIVKGDDLIVTTAGLRSTKGFVDVVHVDTGNKLTRPIRLAGGDEPRQSVFSHLASGVHRVTAKPADKSLPAVSDYVYVVEP